jgi:hypothetical protein
MTFVKSYKRYFKKAAMVWAVCFAVFLLAYLLVLGPQKKEKKRIRRELEEKKMAFEAALQASEKQTKEKLNEQIENLRNRLKDFVVDFEDSANLTFKISQLAGEKDVDAFSIKGKENVAGPGRKESTRIDENHMIISFVAGLNQFATFLSDLERHRPVLLVDKFSMSRSAQDDSVFRVTLNVAAFVTKQQKTNTANKNSTQIYGAKI